VEYSLELCTAGGSGALAAIFRMGLGGISRSSSREMAQAFVNDRIRRVRFGGGVVNALRSPVPLPSIRHPIEPVVQWILLPCNRVPTSILLPSNLPPGPCCCSPCV
jgi:hypothetical protein